jgi:4-amino-4-deoxy-L-arabinose transferase-like glycosyltransferase
MYLSFAMVLDIGGRLQIDPLLSLLILAALVALPDDGVAGSDTRGRMRWAGAWTGLAMLAKGPVALLVVVLVLAAWTWIPGVKPRPSWRGWGTALALAVLPVSIWAVAASVREPELARQLFFQQHLGRAVSDEAPHAGPPWKPGLRLLGFLLPWTPLVLAGVWRSSRRRMLGADPGLARAWSWFAVLLILFSLLPPKRDLYLLPAYPALALIGARELAAGIRARRLGSGVGSSTAVILLLIGVMLVAVGIFNERIDPALSAIIPGFWWRVSIIGLPVILAAGIAFACQRREQVEAWARTVLLGTLAAWIAMILLVSAPLDATKSARALALELAARPEHPAEIPCIGVRPEGYRFYGGLPTVVGGLAEAIAREGDLLALVDQRDWEGLRAEEREALVVLSRRLVGSHCVLVCGRASTAMRSN